MASHFMDIGASSECDEFVDANGNSAVNGTEMGTNSDKSVDDEEISLITESDSDDGDYFRETLPPTLTVNAHHPNVEHYSTPEYSGEIQLTCCLKNFSSLSNDEYVISPPHYIRNIPFNVMVGKFTNIVIPNANNFKRMKTECLEFKIEFTPNLNDSEWSCQFITTFSAIDNSIIPENFERTKKSKVTEKRPAIIHCLDLLNVQNLDEIRFDIVISAEIPSIWSSLNATGFIGIRNEGATCYINSLLQSLHAISEFRRIVYNAPVDADDVNDSFVFDLKYIFYMLQSHRSQNIRAKQFVNHFNWPQMTLGDQQDIHEFSRRLIDALNEYLSGTELVDSLQNLFSGQIKTSIDCEGRVNAHVESFWDLQLSVQNNDDIEAAFESYLEVEKIDDYSYGNSLLSVQQRREFITLPPVLYVSLLRFQFDPKTCRTTKSNKLFSFGRTLDLSKYLPEHSYSLQSVLVHSGNVNTGHYTAFIDPICDDKWYKFDDKTVTKCSSIDAIENNFGNRGETNAYMLVYIKDADVPRILEPITIDSIPSVDLFEMEYQKDKQIWRWVRNRYEVTVFIPDRLVNIKLKRCASIFDVKNRGSFITVWIERTKTLQDFWDLLCAILALKEVTTKMLVWKVTGKGEIDVWRTKNDVPVRFNRLNVPLTDIFDCIKNSCFVQLIKNQAQPSMLFDLDTYVLVFLKHYDAATDTITYFDCHTFEIGSPLGVVFAFIRRSLGLDHMVRLIIYVEDGRRSLPDPYLESTTEKIKEVFHTSPHCSETLVFEIVDEFKFSSYNSKVLSLKNEQHSQLSYDSNLDQGSSSTSSTASSRGIFSVLFNNNKRTDDIHVKLKDVTRHYDDIEMLVPKDTNLKVFWDKIAFNRNCEMDQVVLQSTSKTPIDKEFQEYSVEDFIEIFNKENVSRVTRSKCNNVEIYYDIGV